MRLLIPLVVALGLTWPVQASRMCGPVNAVRNALEDRFGELPAARGIVSGQASVFELLVAPDGSWTIVQITAAKGPAQVLACVVSTGSDWTDIAAPPPGDGM